MSTERYEVAKAGGWSLANGERIKYVVDYLKANQDIHYFVPSAPGVVTAGDKKVTDLLIECCNLRENNRSFVDPLAEIHKRYTGIANYWGYGFSEGLVNCLEQGLNKDESRDWVLSRGEWINGQILAEILGFYFVDPTELIRFRKDGKLDERSYSSIKGRLKGENKFVIPGFYGLGADGRIQLFPRDGSDVTGSVIARGVNAAIYRNLTNIDGVFSADPQIVTNSQLIEVMTFEEYRELGNGGAKVLHRDAVIPVASCGIPINIRHSEKPDSRGTMVVSTRSDFEGVDVIGVAGKKGFASLNIHKYGMNEVKGVEERVLRMFLRNGISIEHVPSSNDYLSVIFDEKQFNGDMNAIEEEIIEQVKRIIKPNRIGYQRDLGLLYVVGQGIINPKSQASGRLFSALEAAQIPCKGYTLGVSGINIIAVIDQSQLDEAIKIAHDTFIK